MDKKKQLEELKSRKDKFEYKGNLIEYQLLGNRNNEERYMTYEVDPFNQYQNFLYKRALFGLKIYSQEEISAMNKEKRIRISKVHRKTQRILNVYKQEVVNMLSNNIFKKLFPASSITKALLGKLDFVDNDFISTLDFKTLGITKDHIVNRMIQERILPKNFYELKSITLHD